MNKNKKIDSLKVKLMMDRVQSGKGTPSEVAYIKKLAEELNQIQQVYENKSK